MQAPVVESAASDFQTLQSKLINRNQPKTEQIAEAPVANATKEDTTPAPETKRFTFKKGDQSFDVDEDAEIEMMADKVPMKLSLKELKDRAAGDIAVKNRMHQLAEEKKKVQATLRDFARVAKDDPLKALEYISNKAKEADSSFEYDSYLKALADQADRLSKMSESDRKAYKLEQKLTETEKDLSQAKQVQVIRDRGAVIMQENGITESQFGDLVQSVLENEVLMDKVEDESQLMDVVGSYAREVRTQQKVYDIAKTVDKNLANDSKFLFYMSDVLQDNPDLDENDIRDMIEEVAGTDKKKKAEIRLSAKQSATLSTSPKQSAAQEMTEYEILAHKLLEKRNKR